MDKKKKNHDDDGNLEFADQKIIDVGMEKEVKTSFIQYSMSVIMSRALPDVRDGLKPVHRRILYAMYEDHLTYDKSYHKSAATVGNVLGRYHPHGDAAVYDAMVRLAQNFSLRYPLIDGQGNFGNIDGDQAAAYRYTEARMSRLADEMLRDINKKAVDFTPTFDYKREEPVVLPARYPNLLINGSVGIAVGMATNIPPHNMGEVIDGTLYLMEHPDATIPELMQYIKGPDFPTGATICGTAGILAAYMTGKGRITVRSKAQVDEEKHRIIITEIPYMVNKANMVEAMADCVKDKRIDGVTALRDESGKDGLRIVVEYRRDANGQVILNQFYKYTQLQDTCAVNMLALVDNVPKILNLKQMLQYYIEHQENVIRNRVKFDLDRALHDAHIFEGYKIAIDNIEEVISIIRSSESVAAAKVNLMERFALSDEQAQAIVDMPLGRLSNMERLKVEERLAKLYEQIADFRAILADEGRVKQIISEEMTEIRNRFSDARRTEIVPMEDEIILEDLIERHTCVITMTHAGYIKRQPSDVYSAQRRGGKGIIGMTTKEEDAVEHCIAMNSHSFMMLFTNTGKVHIRKAYQIPESARTAKGTNIVNVLDLAEGEKITALISVSGFRAGEYLTMVTKNGVIKRTEMIEYEIQRRGGKIALALDEGDELVYVHTTNGSNELLIATAMGYAVRFDEKDVRCMGRTARGVRGITLSEGDAVVGAAVVDETKKLLIITEKGFGKRADFADFPLHNRGGKGVRCHNTERTGMVAGLAAVEESDDVMIITNDGTIIRTPVAGIPVYGRNTGGVIIMKLSEGSYISNFALVAREEPETVEGEESDATEPATVELPAEKGRFDDGDDGEDSSAPEEDDGNL